MNGRAAARVEVPLSILSFGRWACCREHPFVSAARLREDPTISAASRFDPIAQTGSANTSSSCRQGRVRRHTKPVVPVRTAGYSETEL